MGNTYRSRLAEAYLKYLDVPGVYVRSAGIKADQNLNGHITSYAADLLHEYGLEEFGKPTWTALGQGLLDQVDMAICMNRQVYEEAMSAGYTLPLRTFIWDVADVNFMLAHSPDAAMRVPHVARHTFTHIIGRVNELVVYLRRPKPTELVDILTADGRPTGRRTDVDSIHTRGLWHQGVHAVVYTDQGAALFEKRSESIIGNSGLWDMTMGGICDAGEDPDATVRRELEEELGVRVAPGQITKLFVWRYNHYLPRYGLHNRSLVHTYVVETAHPDPLQLQESEVADARYLRFRQAAAFIGAGRSTLGRMTSTHNYYRKVLAAAEQAHRARVQSTIAL